MQELNYESDLEIDPEALDVEWVEQPSLYMRYAQQYAICQRERDFAKERRDVYAAKFAKQRREEEVKISEARINSELNMDEEYLRLQKNRLEKEYECNLLQGSLIAIDHRKRALEKLVDLANREYFASPKIGRDLGSEVAKRKMERNRKAAGANAAVKKSMGRKKEDAE